MTRKTSLMKLFAAATMVLVVGATYAATPLALWSMDPTGQNIPCVLDRRVGPGQGTVIGNQPVHGATNDHLITFNGLGNTYYASSEVAPLSMFVNGNSGGLASFEAWRYVNVDGALFYPQDLYGNEFSFQNSFSVELFFKTDGDQSGGGFMQLVKQGETNFRFGLVLNEGGPGYVRFAIGDGSGFPVVDVGDRNYADGTWHYLVAVLDKSVGAHGALRLTIANEDGTDTTATLNLTAPFANTVGNDGNLFIGRNTFGLGGEPRTFFGFIDEVQISSGAVQPAERIGRIPSVDGPAPTLFAPSIGTEPESQAVVNGGLVALRVTATGSGDLGYRWRKNGSFISGATSSSYSIFPATSAAAGNYDVVITNLVGGKTSEVAQVSIVNPYPIAMWKMQPTGVKDPAVLDSRTEPGQGTLSGGFVGAGLASEHLFCLNELNDTFSLTNDVPPANMFVRANGGSTGSYNAGIIANVSGGLFYPQDAYGNEFSFRGPFTVEIFFKTDGDQSFGSMMQLVRQGEGAVRYTLSINESAPGGLRFAVSGGTGEQYIDLTDKNYADGGWHYVIAIYDTLAGANGQLKLNAVKANGSEGIATPVSLSTGFGPLAAGNDGNLFLGRNTWNVFIDPRTCVGFINQVQVSAGVVAASDRMGWLPSVDGTMPSSVKPYIYTQPVASAATPVGGPFSLSVFAQGSPEMTYQWRKNGAALSGGTGPVYTVNRAVLNDGGVYDVIVANSVGAETSSVANVTVAQCIPIARWSMDTNTAGGWAVTDSRTNAIEGLLGGKSSIAGATMDNLFCFNPLGDLFRTSNVVPPAGMFTAGHNGGVSSYDGTALSNSDGVLFFPTDEYGDEFSFQGPFSVEVFFKTSEDQSSAGFMQIISQGEGFQRISLSVNEPAAGSLNFRLATGTNSVAVTLVDRNYADGLWHYALATYDPSAGPDGAIRLAVANQDGSEQEGETSLPADFGSLQGGNDGNLLVGRYRYSIAGDHRNFLGLIDEVQVTSGVVTPEFRLGQLSSGASIVISNVSKTAGVTAFQWTSTADTSYQVEYVEKLGETWQTIATVPGTAGTTTYTDINSGRQSKGSGFYRIVK